MKSKKKLRLKKFYLHPVTSFILLTLLVMLISGILSLIGLQATYSTINAGGELETQLVEVENLFNFNGLKYLISNASKNFISFTTLSTLLLSLIGLSIAQATGFLDAFIKRVLKKVDNKKITFLIILIATLSSLINDVGYVIVIPLAAYIFLKKNRNPLAGITAAFCGVAFGYGATVFVGSMEVNLISTTESAARLIDSVYHVPLTSNLIIIILSSIVLSIIGTMVIEKIVIPSLGKYKDVNDFGKTTELEVIENIEDEEKKLFEEEQKEKHGIRCTLVTSIIILLFFIYSLIPHLPFSGLLLDMDEYTYLDQVFGENAYFQDGFTYLVSIFFIVTGISYGIGAKTIKNDRELIVDASKYMQEVTYLITMVFFATQFVAVFRKTNISTVLTAIGANIINDINFSGVPLLIAVIALIAIVNLFNTTPTAKWSIFAPIVVPKLMQNNISPEFAQFILRAADSMTKGLTPLLPYFVIFVGYLNIYNSNKKHPITIGNALKLITPYCLIISIVWLVIILLWYLTGLPIGFGIYPTI